eukprot:1142376-Pelagomonas_calceolata.AAC.2
MSCARIGRACCRSWPRPDTGCSWVAKSGDLMPEVICGGRLWCWYCLCWVLVVGLRVSINVGGGVECFIEVGINEATNVGVIYTAVSRKNSGFSVLAGKGDTLAQSRESPPPQGNSSVKFFSGWKVDEGCQSIECHLTFVVHPEGDVSSCIPFMPRPIRGHHHDDGT